LDSLSSPGLGPSSETSENQVITTTEAQEEEEEEEEEEEFVMLFNPHGSGGECRYNYHCRGRERCVRRNWRYICTAHLCNEDKDCPDGRVCRDHKCRYCSRCKDDIEASLPN